MDSYYIDMIHDTWFLEMIDRPRLKQTLEAFHPGVVIVGNGEANEAVDYGSREDCRMPIADVEMRQANPCQTALCQSRDWWSTVPASNDSVARYSPEHLFRFLVLTAGANVEGGGLAVGASPYLSQGFEPNVKESIRSLGNLIQPIAESLKDTYPSTSYITPAGATITSLLSGVAATRSACGDYEYLHVLLPPQGQTLRLPAPLDGKRFGTAVMLRTGRSAGLVQDNTGITLTIEDEWDPLDTVVRLTVLEKPVCGNLSSEALPHAQMKVTADSEYPDHPAQAVIDDHVSTFWQSRPDQSHWITLDLGGQYRVHQVRLLPRQDGENSDCLRSHLCTYSIYTSLDGQLFRPVSTGEWKRTLNEKAAAFPPVSAQYVRLTTSPDWLPHTLGYPHGTTSAAIINIDRIRE